MTAINRLPETQDFLSPLGFQFLILKAPAVNFFVQRVSLPGLGLGEAQVNTPFAVIKFPGTKLDYTDLNITFKVDEKLQAYLEIHNWMKRLGFPDSFDQYADVSNEITGVDGLVSDLSLVILNNHKNPIFTITFKDAFPNMLSPLEFDATAPDLEYLTASTSFAYRSYDIAAQNT